jgi:hypothetical protein
MKSRFFRVVRLLKDEEDPARTIMPKRSPIRVRPALRMALLLTVAGCDAGATFGGCWMPDVTFSDADAGAQTRTTSATVPVAPRRDDPSTADQSASPDQSPSTSDTSSSGAPRPLYNRIPAFPEPPPAPSATQGPRSTIVYYVPTTAAPGAPGAPGAQGPQGAPDEVASEGSSNGEAPPPPEVIAVPLDLDSRRAASEGSSMVMPGVRPPPPPGPQPPQAQGSQEQAPPAPVLPGPRPQPGPMNFRVPPPPPPGPPIP